MCHLLLLADLQRFVRFHPFSAEVGVQSFGEVLVVFGVCVLANAEEVVVHHEHFLDLGQVPYLLFFLDYFVSVLSIIIMHDELANLSLRPDKPVNFLAIILRRQWIDWLHLKTEKLNDMLFALFDDDSIDLSDRLLPLLREHVVHVT